MIKGKSKNVKLEELFFDPDNPRLPPSLQGITDQAPVIKHMIRDESVVDLMGSIGEAGYLDSEPLLVVPRGDRNGYFVVEGNRRLAALKLLANPELATIRQTSVNSAAEEAQQKPLSIPVIEYEKRAQILDYLGYRHITGVKNWGSLEKARYLKQLYEHHKGANDQSTFKMLARIIGSRSDYVGKLLVALQLYDRANDKVYYGVDIEEKNLRFSLLSTAIGYEKIQEFIGLKGSSNLDFSDFNEENFGFLFAKIYDPKDGIGDSRRLKQLSEVVSSDEALSQYRNGASLSEAILYTDVPIKVFEGLLNEAQKKLSSADQAIKSIDQASINGGEQYDRVLNEIINTARGIKGILSEPQL